MVMVSFTRSWSPYNAGEQAGFPDAAARRLIAQGYATAVLHGSPVDKAEAAPALNEAVPVPSPEAAEFPLSGGGSSPVLADGEEVVGSSAHRRRRR